MQNKSFSIVFELEYSSCGAELTWVQASPEAPSVAMVEFGEESSQLLLSHHVERR
jgi:hypothetical protein